MNKYLDRLESNSDVSEQQEIQNQNIVNIAIVKKCIKEEYQPDFVLIHLKELEGDKKRLAQGAMLTKNEARYFKDRIELFTEKINVKQKMIDKQIRYNVRLEEVMYQIKDRIGDFLDISAKIDEVLKAKQEILINDGQEKKKVVSEYDINLEQQDQSFQQDKQRTEQIEVDLSKEYVQEHKKERKLDFRKRVKIEQHKQAKIAKIVYNSIDEVPSSDPDVSQSIGLEFEERQLPHQKGAWTFRERQKYLQFVDENREILDKPELCYKARIYIQMSQFIKSRNVKQCRTFHKNFTRGKRPEFFF